jgi:DNA invertase Pin-like site-specific DNA recombinase
MVAARLIAEMAVPHCRAAAHHSEGCQRSNTMSTSTNGSGLHLSGAGAAYIRVSSDKQDVERQYADLADFEQRHAVKVAKHHRYEDHMARDLSDKRPDFQQMLKAAKAGAIQWIWIQRIDRFGVEDGYELVSLIRDLHKAGCRLIDHGGTDWANRNILTLIQAGLAGEQSRGEQVEKSFRSLDGMVKKAKAGRWMGGPPKFGFDVACFDQATGTELWRAVWEGRDEVGTTMRRGKEQPEYFIRRQKVYPNGSTERLDGSVVFCTSEETQVMRTVPTRDEKKLQAVRDVFHQYATEAVSFLDLAKRLNRRGLRNSYGNLFQGRDISRMLSDEAYLGYATFNKRRRGRFHRYAGGDKFIPPEPELRGRDTVNDQADIVRSTGWSYKPLVDRETWDAVQRKLQSRGGEVNRRAAKNPEMYLSGLVFCACCGEPMTAGTARMEYYCSTWDKHRMCGTLDNRHCERNGIKQDVIAAKLDCFLAETQKLLEMLPRKSDRDRRPESSRLNSQEGENWEEFCESVERLEAYLAEHHPDDYAAVLAEDDARRQEED